MNRPAYPSDLSDDEWELLKPLIPIHQETSFRSQVIGNR